MSSMAVSLADFATPLNRATVTPDGALKVTGSSGAAAALNDATANPTTTLSGSADMSWNGATWERVRSNEDIPIFSSTARTATHNSSDLTNINGRGIHLVIDVTAITATPSVVFTIQGKDGISGKYYTLLASAAITGTGTTVLKVYPGLTAAANLVASDVVPRTWRVLATHGDADSITYSVGASIIH